MTCRQQECGTRDWRSGRRRAFVSTSFPRSDRRGCCARPPMLESSGAFARERAAAVRRATFGGEGARQVSRGHRRMQLSVDSVGLPRDLPPGWGLLLALSRAIDAVNALPRPRGDVVHPRRHPGQCRQRHHPQGLRHQLQRLARAAMVFVRLGFPRRRLLHAAAQRAHPDRHPLQRALEADPQLDRHPRSHLHAAAVHGADDLSQLAVLPQSISIRARCPAAPAV